jgi:hypothetical protein
MKKRLIATILMILLYMLLVSFTACTYGNAQANDTHMSQTTKQDDTIKNKVMPPSDTISVVLSYPVERDTVIKQKQRAIFKKEVKPIEIDTLQRIRRDSTYKKLEKTEYQLKQQYERIDSIMSVKKR